MFTSAALAIISAGSDLTAAVEFDETAARRNTETLRREIKKFQSDGQTGKRMTEYLESIETRRIRFRAASRVRE
jgi:hypothetical protein